MPRLFQSEITHYDLYNRLLRLIEHCQDTCVDALLMEMERVGTPLDLTISFASGDSLVGMSAQKNDLSTMKVLLRHGAPHDQPHKVSGIIPLNLAKYNGNEEMVNILSNHAVFLNSSSPNIR